jgi:hypothetical protein
MLILPKIAIPSEKFSIDKTKTFFAVNFLMSFSMTIEYIAQEKAYRASPQHPKRIPSS